MRAIWTGSGTWIAAALLIMAWMPSSSSAGDPATTAAEAQYPADDTGRNTRDREGATLTADRQSNSKEDVEITRQIRRAIVQDDSLSTDAHNVKIITSGGVVNGVSRVNNQLEVAKP
jgi:hyperosmotically inducible protein